MCTVHCAPRRQCNDAAPRSCALAGATRSVLEHRCAARRVRCSPRRRAAGHHAEAIGPHAEAAGPHAEVSHLNAAVCGRSVSDGKRRLSKRWSSGDLRARATRLIEGEMADGDANGQAAHTCMMMRARACSVSMLDGPRTITLASSAPGEETTRAVACAFDVALCEPPSGMCVCHGWIRKSADHGARPMGIGACGAHVCTWRLTIPLSNHTKAARVVHGPTRSAKGKASIATSYGRALGFPE